MEKSIEGNMWEVYKLQEIETSYLNFPKQGWNSRNRVLFSRCEAV